MGFSTLIDILGSIVIGGLLLMILLRVNDSAVLNQFTYSGELIVQQGLVETVGMIEYDFRKMGYCENWQNIPDPTRNAIIFANENRISFLTDLPVAKNQPGDGTIDTLHYFSTPVPDTDGEKDYFYLNRVINSHSPKGTNIGITMFKLTYFDSFGEIIPLPIVGAATGSIHSIQIDLALENVNSYDNQYSSMFWRQIRLAARNLGNR